MTVLTYQQALRVAKLMKADIPNTPMSQDTALRLKWTTYREYGADTVEVAWHWTSGQPGSLRVTHTVPAALAKEEFYLGFNSFAQAHALRVGWEDL